MPKAIGVFDDIVDQLIKDNVCNDDVLVHASTCIRGGKALSFIGLSGVGKTTIAFMLAKHFGFQELGDEYALLNCETCTISHEFHPLQIKGGLRCSAGAKTAQRASIWKAHRVFFARLLRPSILDWISLAYRIRLMH